MAAEQDGNLAEIVGIWPAAVWILTGVHFYMSWPDLFVGWKGGLYFVLGTIMVALVIGVASRNLRRGVLAILNESSATRDTAAPAALLVIRLMIGAAEAVLVSLLARSLLQALG